MRRYTKEELAFLVVDYRARNNLTQAQFAEKAGIHYTTVNKIERLKEVTLLIERKVVNFMKEE